MMRCARVEKPSRPILLLTLAVACAPAFEQSTAQPGEQSTAQPGEQSTAQPDESSGAATAPRVSLFLNNNPYCTARLENTAKQEVWPIESQPHLRVVGASLSDGVAQVRIHANGAPIANLSVDVKDGSFDVTHVLERPLEDPERIDIHVGAGFQQSVPIRLQRLHGTARFADGQPVEQPIVLVPGRKVAAVGDAQGRFELVWDASTTVDFLALFDEGYTKTNLEAYIWDVRLPRDVELSVVLDTLEVYALHAWKRDAAVSVFFVPMSLTRLRRALEEHPETAGDEMAMVQLDGAWPRLTREDVSIFSGDQELPLLTFHEAENYMFSVDDEPVTRPAYLVTVPAALVQDDVLKVVVREDIEIDGEKRSGRGEGYFFGFLEEANRSGAR